MNRRRRELAQIAEGEGVENVQVDQTGSNHYKVTGTYRDRPVLVFASLSPSCHHATMNFRGDVRKIIRGLA